MECMMFLCSVTYLFFVVRIFKEQRLHSRLEQTRAVLDLQVKQAVREIAALRKSQEKTSIYRHDMRHHMQYLFSCIENGQFRKAQGYIKEICSEIETNKVTAFCENEAVNLIFSTFAKQAERGGISMEVRAKIPRNIPVSETALCVLLSNALENALRACGEEMEKGNPGRIEVLIDEKKGTLFLQIANSCGDDVSFDNGIPVTDRPGHGVGVKSICTIVQQYDGVYTFSVENGQFILRILI